MVVLKRLRLQNFRNYHKVSISFCDTVNIIEGDNGQGKTNLLEALFFLSIGRSFRTHHLSEIIRTGANYFYVEALFERDGIEQLLKIHFESGERKIFYNDTSYPNFSQLLGLLPQTLYSPLDIEMIMGSPQIRRRFLNLHIAQTDPLYVFHLTRYAKALKQRNAMLKQKRSDTIDVWEEEMAKSAEYLVNSRKILLLELSKRISPYYQRLVPEPEGVELRYQPSLDKQFKEHWVKSRKRELELRNTINGPHRDDFSILRDAQNAKIFASEGQKRSIITAIKLAEFSLLQERAQTVPIMSIDDFGVHLDDHRATLLKKELARMGQVFITTPTEPDVSGLHIRLLRGELLKCQHVA
jgi:DNA replication and repair protein RecF